MMGRVLRTLLVPVLVAALVPAALALGATPAAAGLQVCAPDGSTQGACVHDATTDPEEFDQWLAHGNGVAPQVDDINRFRVHQIVMTPNFRQPVCQTKIPYGVGDAAPPVSEMPCSSQALIRGGGITVAGVDGRALACEKNCVVEYTTPRITDQIDTLTTVEWNEWFQEQIPQGDHTVTVTSQRHVAQDFEITLPAAAPTTLPIPHLVITPTGNPDEYTFNASSSESTTDHALMALAEFTFSDTTQKGISFWPSATVTHKFTGPGPYSVTLDVTDARNSTSSLSRIVDDHLSVVGVFLQPVSPAPNSDAKATVTVQNDGIGPVTGVTPTLIADPAERVVVQGSPTPAGQDLALGETKTFTFDVKTGTAGPVHLTGGATGTGTTHAVVADTKEIDYDIGKADLQVDLSTEPAHPRAASTFTVTANVTNTSGVLLHDVVPGVVTADPNLGVSLGIPQPASIPALASGAEATFTFTAALSPGLGPVDLTLPVSAKDADDHTKSGQGVVTVEAVEGIVVNSEADTVLDTDAKDQGRCDVDPATAGDQCTLRAAIELVNSLAARQTITFDVPGGGTPTFRPPTNFPTITKPVTIDGTTQPGGWVAVNGGLNSVFPTYGIELGAGSDGSIVRGLVVGDFNQGIRVAGGSGQKVAGNRIGTDPTATSSAHNTVGVFVGAPGVTVGGTRAAGCTNDCNVISGNDTGVVINTPGRVDVTGNVIGMDVTGITAIPNHVGLDVGGSATDLTTDTHIGGATPLAGTGLGNLISGNTWDGMRVFGSGDVQVAGNLIGPNDSGSAVPAAWTPLQNVRGIVVNLNGDGTAKIGGDTKAEGNVIGGFIVDPQDIGSRDGRAGVYVVEGGEIEVRNNLIGTNRDGTRQFSNGFGVLTDTFRQVQGLTVRGNVISGNTFWGVVGATEVVGNRIGTTADGTRALPNRGGVDFSGTVGGRRLQGSTTCDDPCNLISGNSKWAVGQSDLVQGNFVGTDPTGTQSLANGTDFDVSKPNEDGAAVLVLNKTVGGESSALRGQCDEACNLVAGNTSAPGVDATVIQGNAIGVGIDGRPLPNHDGIRLSQGGNATIGGRGDLGNVIAFNPHAAVTSVQSVGTAPFDSVVVRGNSIHDNGLGVSVPGYPALPGHLVHVDRAFRTGPSIEVAGTVDPASNGLGSGAVVDLYADEKCELQGQSTVPLGTTAPASDGGYQINDSLDARYKVVVVYTVVRGFTYYSDCVPIAGARTTTTANASAGDTEVQVASNDGFGAGDYAQVGSGDERETRRISGLGSLIFAAPLAGDHPSGTEVLEIDAPGGDTTGPSITVTAPAEGAVVGQGDSAPLTFTCEDTGVGVESCGGAAPSGTPLDTSTPGPKQATVTAWDGNGNVSSRVVHYTVRSAASSNFVSAAYTSFLGRAPSAAELDLHAVALDSGSETRRNVVDGLAASPEWVSHTVDGLYQDILDRAGDEGGRAFWINELTSRHRSVASVAASFYSSPEYYSGLGGGTDTTWVTDLYRKILGREPDAGGLAFWVALAPGNRFDVARRIFQSRESREQRVTALYQQLLHRAPDADGLAYWQQQILHNGDLSLAAALAASDEFFTNAQPS